MRGNSPKAGNVGKGVPRWGCGCATALLLALGSPGGTACGQTPVVFRVSEGVRPGSVVSLYGEYLTGKPGVRFLGSDGSVVATEPAVQADPGGHFVRVVFPAVPPGSYRLSASNGEGWSTRKVFVNRAEPRWLSDDRAYPGLRLKLIGRNLDAWEYNGRRDTRVRLTPVGGGRGVVVAPVEVNPYCVDFTIPEGLPRGGYTVEVNARSAQHGGDWVRLDNHSEFPDPVSDTVLHVGDAPADPTARALQVGWANDLPWDRVVDARKSFDARGDGVSDDTRAIQDALDHVAARGGGVVLLAAGVYRIKNLLLGQGCVLKGKGREATVVMAGKASEDGAIVPRGRAQGISGLTLKYQPEVPANSPGVLLAGQARGFFVHDVTFALVRDPDVRVEQAPYYFTGDGPLLVAGCRFVLSHRNLWDHAVRNRVTFRDNYIDMHDGLGLCMSSEKLLLLRNELTFHAAAYAGQMNGFFLNEGWVGWNIYNAYVAGNNVHDVEGPGDCQPFAADSAWTCFAGGVTGSGPRTVDVRNDLDGDFKSRDNHELELIVARGKGLGQLRRVSARHDLGGKPAVVRFTVSPPWDVPPDATSVVTAGSWHVNTVFYKNTARRSKSPYNMYYGGCYDCVDAEATSVDTDGWFNWGRIGEIDRSPAWHCPVYFNQLRRSTFTGRAPVNSSLGITLRTENETKTYRGVADYGTEIRDNTVDRAACPDRKQRLAGNAAIATFNQSWMKVTDQTPLIFATLCEGNLLKNSAAGFDLDGCFSFAIRGTTYENCPRQVHDRGRDTALLPGSPEPLRPAPGRDRSGRR